MSDEKTYPTCGRWIVAAATPPTSRSPLNRGNPIDVLADRNRFRSMFATTAEATA